MGRYDNYTVPVSADHLRQFAESLRLIATAHDGLAEQMTGRNLGLLEMRNFKSATDALGDLSRFLGAAVEAVVAALSKHGLEEVTAVAAAKSVDAAAVISAQQLVERRDHYYRQLMDAFKMAEDEIKKANEAAAAIEHQREEAESGQATGRRKRNK